MRFLHLADLHFGKSIYGLSLLEKGDQAHWVDEFLRRAAALEPDAVVIAGDVYDRSAPSGDAVALLSRMLTALAELGIPVLLTAGNHDSVQRLAFARPLLAREGLHISSSLYETGTLEHVTLTDEHGEVTFWLMPYVFPALVSEAFGVEGIGDFDAAVRFVLSRQEIDPGRRNVLVAHQNVTAHGVEAQRGGSESMVGGVGQVEYTAFDAFDYVALGHIHAAYPVGRETVRYAGSPLCYHFDELRQPEKGPILVELGAKGAPVRVETLVLPPLHPMRQLRGPYEELCRAELENPRRGEYLRVVLTDRQRRLEEADFFKRLCDERGSELLEIVSEYSQHAGGAAALTTEAVREKSVEELFADYYTTQTGGDSPDEAELALMRYAGERQRRAEPGSMPGQDDIDGLIDVLMGQEGDA